MTKLTMMIRAIMWMLWMLLYVLVAYWVGEGHWDRAEVRLMAAALSMPWIGFGALFIEAENAPKSLAKALMEDDA